VTPAYTAGVTGVEAVECPAASSVRKDMRPLLQSALVAVLFLSAAASAHEPARPPPQQGRGELVQTRRETRDDQKDRAESANLLRRYDAALMRPHRGTLAPLEREALRLMDRELAEGQREVRSDWAEMARSGAEANNRHAPPVARRDDRRDLRDDQRDVRVERRDLQHVRAIREDFAALTGRTSRSSLQKKRALLSDFVARSNRELAQNAQERREDVRERREDLREAHR
jgi:hypothetical protein